ncbi:MAG: 50S ribosomal protein L24 [Acidimicrobiaceae bacterium]|nr:50S ribosomal protein L24 [Acidimicrobiaceae bacterium]
MKFKKGDNVIVIAGKDKGVKGTISAVLPAKGKVIIDNVNVAKRHSVARGQNTKSEIIDKPMPIHASNVMFDQGGKPSKIGYKVDKNGKKVRIAKSTGAEI